MIPQLRAFEDSVFGPDFAAAPEDTKAWAESGCWFIAAVTGQAVVGRRQIFSMLSIFVTTAESRDCLLAGEANESQLQPWTDHRQNSNPVLYLASVISAASDHLGVMYENLARDLQEFQFTMGIEFQSGFGIAAGPSGFNHLARNGFRSLEGCSYRGHYPMMDIDATSAATRFWQDLLRRETVLQPRRVREEANSIALFPAVALTS